MGHGLKIEFLKIEFKCWKIKCVEFHGGYDPLVRNMPTFKYNDQWERNELRRRQSEQDQFSLPFGSYEFISDTDTFQWVTYRYPFEYFWYRGGIEQGFRTRKLDFN